MGFRRCMISLSFTTLCRFIITLVPVLFCNTSRD
jgi:hypothetical protein